MCILAHWLGLLQCLNQTEPPLTVLAPPVILLLRQIKRLLSKSHITLSSSCKYPLQNDYSSNTKPKSYDSYIKLDKQADNVNDENKKKWGLFVLCHYGHTFSI